MSLKTSTTLTVLLLAIAALSAAEPDSPIDKSEILRRTRRWAASACTNVVECLGTLTLILPLRYLLDIELIYDRLTGMDTRIIIINGHREIGLVLAGHYFLRKSLVVAIKSKLLNTLPC